MSSRPPSLRSLVMVVAVVAVAVVVLAVVVVAVVPFKVASGGYLGKLIPPCCAG